MFSEERHSITESELPFDPKKVASNKLGLSVVGVDYGTTNPTCFLFMVLHQGTYYVIDEYYYDSRETMRTKTDGEYLHDLEKMMKKNKIKKEDVPIAPDPSAASFKALLRLNDYKVERVNNDILLGIRKVSQAFCENRFKIVLEKCPYLLGELVGYAWDAKAAIKGDDRPVLENDHAVDALRYGFVNLNHRNYYENLKGRW